MSQSQQNAFEQIAFEVRVFDAMRSQIVSGAPVKLELLELLAVEGVALRSIASGPQALFCSDVGAGSPAWRIGMTTKSRLLTGRFANIPNVMKRTS